MREIVRDVVVVGGGAAGLSAALILARSRRRVTVVDAGVPRNAPAPAVHGLLALDGLSPLELLGRGRDEVTRYGGEIISAEVSDVACTSLGFAVTTRDAAVLHARRLLIATGLVDELPDVAGLRQRWGRDVLHCPYCHGWEADETGRTPVPGGWVAGNSTDLAARVGTAAAGGARAAAHLNADLVAEDTDRAVARVADDTDRAVARVADDTDRAVARLADTAAVR
ncbi:FAD-dependent oxidoreductase [Micromonospora rifamycinica]|uniref:FAD-dependent oxidoreductase n=1 Tax=Micromonospora rifamycinica TaxID=291594 RepID=UPI002E2DA7BF|nr:FAD-dependent oxidoreductase [Micromonospora rifamycinica]